MADETTVLQRQLLRMVHVAEFSPDADFIDPCATLVLRDVQCCRCGGCADLDVCRDPKVVFLFIRAVEMHAPKFLTCLDVTYPNFWPAWMSLTQTSHPLVSDPGERLELRVRRSS